MHVLVTTLLSFTLLVQGTGAAGRVVNLDLPRDLKEDELVVLEVELGVIPRGAEIELETTSGKMLGVISPHGIRSGREAGTYTVPVPRDAICDKRLSLRLVLSFQGEKRGPSEREVKSVRLKIRSAR